MTAILVRLFVASLLAGACGCQVALPQPGQTPAQVQACTNDATAHNVLVGAAGVLSTGAGIESAVATQTDPKVAQGLAIGAAVTAGLAAASTGVGLIFAQAYNRDGCSPALVGRPQAGIVVAPNRGADGKDYAFGELGWKPVER